MVAFRFLYLGLLIGTAFALPIYPRSEFDDVYITLREPSGSNPHSPPAAPAAPEPVHPEPPTSGGTSSSAAPVAHEPPGAHESVKVGSHPSQYSEPREPSKGGLSLTKPGGKPFNFRSTYKSKTPAGPVTTGDFALGIIAPVNIENLNNN